MVIFDAFTPDPRLTNFAVPSIVVVPISCFAAVLSVHVAVAEPSNVVVALPFENTPEAPNVRLPASVICCDPGESVPKFTVSDPSISKRLESVQVALPDPCPNVTLLKVPSVAPVESIVCVDVVAIKRTVEESLLKVALLSHDP
jgi:hypothetical protein